MSHSYSRLIYHCIFSTKDRKPCITADLRDRLYAYIGGILRRHNGHLIKAGGRADHIHVLLELNGTTAVADAIRPIKANSSKWLHETMPDSGEFGWQTGYGAFSTSASAVDDIIRYIDGQESHHRISTFEEEFVAFLRRHNIAYDRRYALDS